MAEAHPTVEAEQTKTDAWAVFGDQSAQLDAHNDLVLVARVEVPRYSIPTVDGVRLDTDKRLALAVTWAVTERFPNPDTLIGEEFMVMRDLDKPMDFVEFEGGAMTGAIPAGVWNPNEESAGEWSA